MFQRRVSQGCIAVKEHRQWFGVDVARIFQAV
jgi:hypothetical protein